MGDRAELLHILAEHIARLDKVENGTLNPAPTDSDVDVLTREHNEALSLVRALEAAGFGLTFEGNAVE